MYLLKKNSTFRSTTLIDFVISFKSSREVLLCLKLIFERDFYENLKRLRRVYRVVSKSKISYTTYGLEQDPPVTTLFMCFYHTKHPQTQEFQESSPSWLRSCLGLTDTNSGTRRDLIDTLEPLQWTGRYGVKEVDPLPYDYWTKRPNSPFVNLVTVLYTVLEVVMFSR